MANTNRGDIGLLHPHEANCGLSVWMLAREGAGRCEETLRSDSTTNDPRCAEAYKQSALRSCPRRGAANPFVGKSRGGLRLERCRTFSAGWSLVLVWPSRFGANSQTAR